MEEKNFKHYIQSLMKEKGVKQWEAAAELGIGETTFVRWLRFDLPKEKQDLIIQAVEKLAAVKEGDSQ